MTRALIIGNGESRAWFHPDDWCLPNDMDSWGCNAIYRDGSVDHLVSVDYAMQQEIYVSGYGKNHSCWFSNWNVIPAEAADMMMMGVNIPEPFIHRSERISDLCVISGKDPVTLHERIEAAMHSNPHLDMDDLKLKLQKDTGIWITYVHENDEVQSITSARGWCAGTTALSLACSKGAKEIYMLGFDLSSYKRKLNNMYKGTANYLPASAKGFNPINWIDQLNEVFTKYSDRTFHWVDCKFKGKFIGGHDIRMRNVRYLTKNRLCDILSGNHGTHTKPKKCNLRGWQ